MIFQDVKVIHNAKITWEVYRDFIYIYKIENARYIVKKINVASVTRSISCVFAKKNQISLFFLNDPVAYSHYLWFMWFSTWRVNWHKNMSLSLSNSPLLVYVKIKYVTLSIKLATRLLRASTGSANLIAFWKTVLNALRENWYSMLILLRSLRMK